MMSASEPGTDIVDEGISVAAFSQLRAAVASLTKQNALLEKRIAMLEATCAESQRSAAVMAKNYVELQTQQADAMARMEANEALTNSISKENGRKVDMPGLEALLHLKVDRKAADEKLQNAVADLRAQIRLHVEGLETELRALGARFSDAQAQIGGSIGHECKSANEASNEQDYGIIQPVHAPPGSKTLNYMEASTLQPRNGSAHPTGNSPCDSNLSCGSCHHASATSPMQPDGCFPCRSRESPRYRTHVRPRSATSPGYGYGTGVGRADVISVAAMSIKPTSVGVGGGGGSVAGKSQCSPRGGAGLSRPQSARAWVPHGTSSSSPASSPPAVPLPACGLMHGDRALSISTMGVDARPVPLRMRAPGESTRLKSTQKAASLAGST